MRKQLEISLIKKKITSQMMAYYSPFCFGGYKSFWLPIRDQGFLARMQTNISMATANPLLALLSKTMPRTVPTLILLSFH